MIHYDGIAKLIVSASIFVFLPLIGCAAPTHDIPIVSANDLDGALSIIAQQTAVNASELKTRDDGLFEFFLDGIPTQEPGGNKTRIFSILGIPDDASGEPLPAIVLVHGGGGTAFADWVQRWNDAGFVALAIATEGQTDENLNKGAGRRQWARHDFSGPKRAGIYKDHAKPATKQWMFHAVSAAITANTYLRSMPEVNPDHVGIAGISWGGIITSTTIGFDQRFDFAIPIYGTGSLDIMPNQYGRALGRQTGYSEDWEPMLRVSKFKSPILWMNGREDTHFTLDAQANTALATNTHNSFSIIEGLKHSQRAAAPRNEPYSFAKTIVSGGAPVDYILSSDVLSEEEITYAFSELPDGMRNADLEVKLHKTSTLPDVFDKDWSVVFTNQIRAVDGALQVTVPVKAIQDAEGWYVSISSKSPTAPLTFSTRYCRVSAAENKACK